MARKEYLGKHDPIKTVTLKCLRCNKPFESVDRKRNRICKECNIENKHTNVMQQIKPMVSNKPPNKDY